MKITSQTEKAYKVFINGESHWLPKSQCWEDGQILHIKSWIAAQKGIDEKQKINPLDYKKFFKQDMEKKTLCVDQSDLAYISTRFEPNDLQQAAIKKANLGAGFIFALKQGVGKTKTCLDEIALLVQKGAIDTVVIVTPNGVKYGWLNEIKKHFLEADEFDFYIWNAKKNKAEENKKSDFINSSKKRFFIINYESVISKQGNKYLDLVIQSSKGALYCSLDEVHKIINRKSSIGTWLSDNQALFEYRRGMSGTLIKKHPQDIWNITKFIDPNIFPGSYWAFAEEYFYIDKTGFGWEVRDFKPGMKEKFYAKLEPYFIFGELDNSVAMPDKMIEVEMPIQAIKQSMDLIEEILAKIFKDKPIHDDELEDMIAINGLNQFQRLNAYIVKYAKEVPPSDRAYLIKLRQLASGFIGNRDSYSLMVDEAKELPKLEGLIEELNGIDLEEDKILIIGTQIPLLKEACKVLRQSGYSDFVYIDGEITGHDREAQLKRFEGKTQILVANYKTISTGLNLQHANRMIFLDIDFQSDELDQVRKRIDRQGQVKPCYYSFLFAHDSIDWAIYHSNIKKLSVQKTVLQKPIEING